MNVLVNKIIPLKDPKKYINQATPFIVHLLMICGVGIYAMFGALVMQSLEAIPLTKYESKNNQNNNGRQSRGLAMNDGNEFLEINRHCLIRAIEKSIDDICANTKATVGEILYSIDSCYHVVLNSKSVDSLQVIEKISYNKETGKEEIVLYEEWSFSDSILFAFTVITTIGYGNVAPKSFGGRMFCIFYGLIGIPFTLLAIADLGKFISEVMVSATNAYSTSLKKIGKKMRKYKDHKYIGFFVKQITSKSLSNSKKTSIYVNPSQVDDLENGLAYKDDENDVEKPLTSQSKSIGRVNKKYSSKDSIVNYGEKASIIEFEDGEKKLDESDSESEDEDIQNSNQTCSLIGLFIIYIIMGAMLLSTYEPEMTFFNAIYFNFVSLTSIGLGDIVPKSKEFMSFTIIYIAIGLALTTIAIDIAADYLKKLHYFGRKIENVAAVTIWFGGKKLTMGQLVRNLGDQFNLPVTTIKNFNLDDFVDKAIKVEAGEIETLRPPPLQPENIKSLDESVVFADGCSDWVGNDNDVEWDIPIIEEKESTPIKSPTPLPKTPTPPPREPTPIKTPTPEPKTPSPIKIPTPIPKTPTPEPKTPTPEPKSPSPELKIPSPTPRTPSPIPKTPSPEKEELIKIPENDPNDFKRRAYSEDAWRRYQEYQKQWQKLRQVKRSTAKSPNNYATYGVDKAVDEVLKNARNRKLSDIPKLDGSHASGSGLKHDTKKSLQSDMFRPISRNRSNLSSKSITPSPSKTSDGKKKTFSNELPPRMGVKRNVGRQKSPHDDNKINDNNDKEKKNSTDEIAKGKPPSITSPSSRKSKNSR
uniref:Potassium channel subfamily K member 18 n=1 Tax=Parastrongyloides trichosuri TaxID=131310 RepID=A0A0N5A3X0_PARTI